MKVLAAVVLALVMAAACSDDKGPDDGEGHPGVVLPGDVERPYAAPLTAPGRYGAAGRAVECDNPVAAGATSVAAEYNGGGIGEDPVDALATYIEKLGWLEGWPEGGYRTEREEEKRVLFTIAVGGERKTAVVVHEAVTPEGDGWFVESWARCDPAEFPDAVAVEMGHQVWSDRDGRVATDRIVSYDGPQHCDWEQATILRLGEATYWRDAPAELSRFFDVPYAEAMQLPADAQPTPYSRNGKRLWLSPDRAVAYVGTAADRVERWVRPGRPLGCA